MMDFDDHWNLICMMSADPLSEPPRFPTSLSTIAKSEAQILPKKYRELVCEAMTVKPSLSWRRPLFA